MWCRELQCEYTAILNPSDDTWTAIKVYRDGNEHVLDRGFATEDEACARRHKDADVKGWAARGRK